MIPLLQRAAVWLFLAIAMAVVPAVSVMAQQNGTPPDYNRWDGIADAAENVIDVDHAATAYLEELRNELAHWRHEFQKAQNVNHTAVVTAQSRLEALGPEPEDGSEPEDVARQREEINQRLSQLIAPIKSAKVAYGRADGLIKGIDLLIRNRQKEKLLQLGPSPVNPKNWPAGASAIIAEIKTVEDELRTSWDIPRQLEHAQERLPASAVLVLIGLVLLIRGKTWSSRLVNMLLKQGETASAGRWILAFAASLGALILPFLGVVVLVRAVYITGFVGTRGDLLLSTLLPTVLIYFLQRWLAMRVFPSRAVRQSGMQMDDAGRRKGRLYGTLLGLITALMYFFNTVSDYAEWPEAATNVVLFLLILLAALLLVRLSRLISNYTRDRAEAESEDGYRGRLPRLLANAMLALAIVAPLLAAIGYFQAAQYLMLPSLLSLLLLAALIVLQRVVTELYSLITGSKDSAEESLVPVLLGGVVLLLSLPLFALIWGARVADLTELWAQFNDGIHLGETHISPSIFLTLAAVFAIGFAVTRLLQSTLKNSVLPKTKMDVGGRNAVISGVGYVGIFLASIIAITSAGIDLSSLAIVAGALSVGIGFGLQNIVSNFVSGIILLIERPISEGDWIEVGGQMGYVRDISVRSTRIETFDRTDVIVPNADFVSGTVTNYTRGNTVGRVIVQVGIAYGTDTKQVESILREIAEAHPMVLMNPPPDAVFVNIGDSTLEFEIRAILRDVNWVMQVKSDLNHEIIRRMGEAGIEIAFPQRDLWIRNPEALWSRGASKTPPKAATPQPKRKEVAQISDGDMPGDADPDAGGPDG